MYTRSFFKEMIDASISHSAKNFIALLLCVVIIGFALGANYPIVTFTMHHNGFSATIIGAMASCYAIASMVSPLTAGRVMEQLGIRRSIILYTVLMSACILIYPLIYMPITWFIVRFIHGFAVNSLFTMSEYHINALADYQNRGKILGLYVTLLSIGFAGGPLLLMLVGFQGIVPFLTIVLILAASAIPIVLLLNEQTLFSSSEEEGRFPPIFAYFKRVPHVVIGGAIYGAGETIVIALAPIFTLNMNYTEHASALVLTFFTLGNVLFQIPIGYICHRISPALILFTLALMSSICAIILGIGTFHIYVFYGLMLLFGGAICGIYTTALVILGNTFRTDLVSANATFAFFYSAGSLVGPLLCGTLLDRYPINGFTYLLGGLCAGYSLFLIAYYFFSFKRL